MRFDVLVEGPDAAECAVMLKIPSLGRAGWGWLDQIEAAAQLRRLRVEQLARELGLDVTVRIEDRTPQA